MSVMAESAFDEAIIDIIQPESVLTSTDIINVRSFIPHILLSNKD